MHAMAAEGDVDEAAAALGLTAYELQRLERIRRNREARLSLCAHHFVTSTSPDVFPCHVWNAPDGGRRCMTSEPVHPQMMLRLGLFDNDVLVAAQQRSKAPGADGDTSAKAKGTKEKKRK